MARCVLILLAESLSKARVSSLPARKSNGTIPATCDATTAAESRARRIVGRVWTSITKWRAGGTASAMWVRRSAVRREGGWAGGPRSGGRGWSICLRALFSLGVVV